ncbi:MAG: glycosyltransferase family 2 protein [Paludibacteraceae bacterium]|nr:glycosyltransferase family 2 protein [Paludibacteraceae bacterium]
MVDILMATYNGEAFVGEQIESIMKQTYADWRLLVHDDGSTDATKAIVKKFSDEDKRIRLIEDGIEGLGVAKNFIHMLNYADAEYIMFCDQDDIWLPCKVEKMTDEIGKKNNNIPQVVYSNAYLWSPTKGIISDKNTLTYPNTLRQMLFLNTGIQGAASIFNKCAKELLMRPLQYYAMHDHTLLLCMITMGGVSYMNEPLMYYRQHDRNVTGNAPGSMKKKTMQMWQNRHVPIVSREHLEGLRAFYDVWRDHLTADDREVIEVFMSLPEKNFAMRVYYICKYRFCIFGSTFLLLAKLCLRRYI